jgi:hypothetical protein
MPEISTGCLLSAMFGDIIRASIHDRDSRPRPILERVPLPPRESPSVIHIEVEYLLNILADQLQGEFVLVVELGKGCEGTLLAQPASHHCP